MPYWPGDSPGAEMIDAGLVNRLGSPFLSIPPDEIAFCVMLTGTCEMPSELELMSQSVAQREPSFTVKGRPDVCRQLPVTCQPPTAASRTLFMFCPIIRPRPTGIE